MVLDCQRIRLRASLVWIVLVLVLEPPLHAWGRGEGAMELQATVGWQLV